MQPENTGLILDARKKQFCKKKKKNCNDTEAKPCAFVSTITVTADVDNRFQYYVVIFALAGRPHGVYRGS